MSWQAIFETAWEAATATEIGTVASLEAAERAGAAALATTTGAISIARPHEGLEDAAENFKTDGEPMQRLRGDAGPSNAPSTPRRPPRKRTASGTLKPPPPIHRRIEPVSNMPERRAAVSNAKNSKNGHVDEVEVMPHYGPMSKIIEDYHTINLSYYHRDRVQGTGGTNDFTDRVFRLNSIFDVDELGSGDSGAEQPLGRDLWASVYQYYRVLSCDVDIKIINYRSNDTLLAGVVIEEDNATLTTTPANFMMRKNAIRTIIPGKSIGNQGVGHLTYHYSPQNWDHHVTEVGIDERWTPVTTSPAVNHRLIFRTIGADGSDQTPSGTDYEVFLTMKFTVQFREANKTILTTGNLSA